MKKPRTGPNQHMQSLQAIVKMFEEGKAKQFAIVCDAHVMGELVDRGGAAVQALGYPVLYSRHMASISGGTNDNKKGLGLEINYLALNHDTIDRLRGRPLYVFNIAEMGVHTLSLDNLRHLDDLIAEMNSRMELPQ
jgi:hypothetical protein